MIIANLRSDSPSAIFEIVSLPEKSYSPTNKLGNVAFPFTSNIPLIYFFFLFKNVRTNCSDKHSGFSECGNIFYRKTRNRFKLQVEKRINECETFKKRKKNENSFRF